MQVWRKFLGVLAVAISATGVGADTNTMENGGDTFVSGGVITQTLDTPGDAFATARTLNIGGETLGDLHATGLDVTVTTNTAEDLYAMGGTVVVRSRVAQDLTAAGFSVRTDAVSRTGGNARLFGRTVSVDGPVDGALTITAQDVVLNAAITGDVRILAQSISFGPKAVVAGTLTYSSKTEISVPDRVAAPDRVVFEKASMGKAWSELDGLRREMPGLPTFASLFFGFVVSLLFFIVLGAVMLGFMPRRLEALRKGIMAAPGQSMLLGIIGLSMLFGMVPIIGLTIVGLPFVPIAILFIIVAWTLGYALGAYSVAMRVWAGFNGTADPTGVTRLLIFAAAITVVALLHFIPFVGWVVNYTLVLLGMGAMTRSAFQYLTPSPDGVFDIDMQPIDD